MNLFDRLQALVAIDSNVAISNAPLIQLLQSWFADFSTEVQEWETKDGVKSKNLVVKIPGKISTQATVFICHIDTVPTSSKWTTDPFTLVEKEDKLYGLGSCDTKGGVAALIEAVLTLKDQPGRDTYIVFDGDEENTKVGINTYLKTMDISNPQFVAIEPTDGNICISQRSLIKLRITTHGVSQHSSKAIPELNDADNAIHKMAKVMMVLQEDAKKLSEETDELLGTHTQNFGVISGGVAHNVVPDSCSLIMHRRLLPKRNVYEEKEYITKLLMPIDSSVTVEHIGEEQPGFSTPESSPFVKQVLTQAKKQLPNAHLSAFIAWSEAGMTSSKGESVILGPGSIHQAHNANEFVSKKELSQFVTLFSDIIKSIVIQ